MAQKYDATLNLPKTEFPMRAGLPKREPEMLKHWEEMDIYNEMLKKNEGKPLFNLHDGPPFSNGCSAHGSRAEQIHQRLHHAHLRNARLLYAVHPRLG